VFTGKEFPNGKMTIFKRYSQFATLHKELKPISKKQKTTLPPLPYKKNIMGYFKKKNNKAKIEYRK